MNRLLTILLMMRAPHEKRKPALSQRAAARLLGCNHGHLSRVLRGERVSKSLSRRYAALFHKTDKAK